MPSSVALAMSLSFSVTFATAWFVSVPRMPFSPTGSAATDISELLMIAFSRDPTPSPRNRSPF